MNPELVDKVKGLISERFGVPMEKLQPDATLDSLEIDSLAMIEFMFDVEDTFGINLSNSRDPIRTLDDVFNEIDRAVSAKNAGGA
jgi:acyl carrier protein